MVLPFTIIIAISELLPFAKAVGGVQDWYQKWTVFSLMTHIFLSIIKDLKALLLKNNISTPERKRLDKHWKPVVHVHVILQHSFAKKMEDKKEQKEEKQDE